MKVLLSAAAALLILMCVQQVAAAEAARPNILFLYVDDLGWGSIGPNGQADRKASGLPYVRTPHLDRLAAAGINFTRGYGCTVCSPARSSLQTGFHQGHTFADRNDPNNAKKAIRADDVSIGTALSSVGYVTGYWGKWGYGGSKDRRRPVIENIQTLPVSHGYQHVLAELHHVRAHTFFQPTLWSAPAAGSATGGMELIPNSMARYQPSDAWPNTPALQNHAGYPRTAYCDDVYSFAALDFVRRQGQNYHRTGQPFFGLLAVQIPHAPFAEIATLPDWDRRYSDDPLFSSLSDQSQQWAAMVTRIDAHFGNLLAALEDPNQDGDPADSIAGDTLVVFQSDNGGPDGRSNVELNANGGLSGSKGSIHEGGIRVPLVMRWPAKITAESKLKAGTNCSRVVDVSDLLPTFCELAGTVPPVGIDGVSIAPMLLGSGHQRSRDFIIHEAGAAQSIIRGHDKLVRSKRAQLSLFDLQTDPAEKNDLAAQQSRLVAELKSLLLAERVAEPKGFANTYHSWNGPDGGGTADADHWSDYRYANAGVTYLQDAGPPRPSWIATIRNAGTQPRTACVDADLDVLGLQIQGTAAAGQSLTVGPNIELNGRNEVRLAAWSNVSLHGGTIRSLRWVDVHPHATLAGHGEVIGTVFNNGVICIKGSQQPQLNVQGDYHQLADGVLRIPFSLNGQARLHVSGEVRLNGTLAMTAADTSKTAPGESLLVVAGKRIVGRFSNPADEVVSSAGVTYAISYSDSAVTLTAK